MKAIDFLRRQVIGHANGRPVMSRRSYRGALIALIAGGRTVVINAKIERGSIHASAVGAVIAGNTIS